MCERTINIILKEQLLELRMLSTSCFSEQNALALESEVQIQHARSAYQHRCKCALSTRCVEAPDFKLQPHCAGCYCDWGLCRGGLLLCWLQVQRTERCTRTFSCYLYKRRCNLKHLYFILYTLFVYQNVSSSSLS